MTDPHDIDALKRMTTGEKWVWLAGQLAVIDSRLKRLESKRWHWLLGGGSVAGIGGISTIVMRRLNIL